MSKQNLKSKQGQRGEGIRLSASELTDNERRLVAVLAKPGRPTLTIPELATACKWKRSLGKARGNSRVRNTLRRLVRARWVEHPDGIGDGRYRLTSSAKAKLKRAEPTREVAAAALN